MGGNLSLVAEFPDREPVVLALTKKRFQIFRFKVPLIQHGIRLGD